jgi:hypothetical protein
MFNSDHASWNPRTAAILRAVLKKQQRTILHVDASELAKAEGGVNLPEPDLLGLTRILLAVHRFDVAPGRVLNGQRVADGLE